MRIQICDGGNQERHKETQFQLFEKLTGANVSVP